MAGSAGRDNKAEIRSTAYWSINGSILIDFMTQKQTWTYIITIIIVQQQEAESDLNDLGRTEGFKKVRNEEKTHL